MVKVSIIVPIYNVEKYLANCLESLINQTYQDIELICINDGSTDQSPKILEQYAQKDPRIIMINQENKGISCARNTGLEKATGEYITFVDSDDALSTHFVEVMLRLVEDNKADLAECACYKVKDPCSPYPQIQNEKSLLVTDPFKYMLNKKPLGIKYMAWGRLYKAKLIKNRKFIEGIYFEDYPWTISLMLQKPKVVLTNLKLYYYTMNQTSVTKTNVTPKKIHDYFFGMKFVYEEFISKNEPLCFLKQKMLPNLLKTQLKLIKKAKNSKELLSEFKKELQWCQQKKLLSIFNHNWCRYYQYMKILKNPDL